MTEKNPVQPLIFFKTDKDGYIINTADINNISKEWHTVFEDIKYTFQRYSHGKLHSIYLIGDFLSNRNANPDADVEIIIIGIEEFGALWLEEYIKYLLEKYPFTKNIEFIFQKYSDLMNSGLFKFRLKSKALCIFGDNILLKLPPYKVSSDIAFFSNSFESDLDRVLEGIQSEKEKDNKNTIRNLCRYFTRITLTVGFEICMEKEKKYSDDLYTYYRIFSKYFPDKEMYMKEIYNLSKVPTHNLQILEEIVTGIGRWLGLKIRLENLEKKLKTKNM